MDVRMYEWEESKKTEWEAEGRSLDTSGAETFKSDCHRETQKTVWNSNMVDWRHTHQHINVEILAT